jgi:16S rRNA processing protein RimM
MTKRVCLGAFAGAHGVRGEAKVKTFTEAEESIARYGPVESEDGKRRFMLRFIRVLKPGIALVAAPEIRSREDAAALTGVRVYVAREALPPADEDEFYIEDLIGLRAVDETGAPLGAVAGFHDFGAGGIIELAGVPGRGEPVMAPFTRETVPRIDLAAGVVVIRAAALDDSGEGLADPALIGEAIRQEDA